MNNPIQINNLNPNEVSVVLPDGTTVYGPVQSVIEVIKGIKAPAKTEPVAPTAPKQTENQMPTMNVFNKTDRKSCLFTTRTRLNVLNSSWQTTLISLAGKIKSFRRCILYMM